MTNALITCMIAGYQWVIILVIILLLFGGKKIPELMKGVGKGVKAFKEGMNEVEKQVNTTSTPAADKKNEPANTSEENKQ